MRPVAPGSPTPPTGVRGLRNEGAAGAVLPCAANRWRLGTRLGRGQRWQAVGGEKTRCALALRQVTAGGRPSRGAEQKARCRLPEDMREAHRFRGRGSRLRGNDAGGGTGSAERTTRRRKRLAMEAATARWEHRARRNDAAGWSAAAKGDGGVCQGRRHKKAHDSSAFFYIAVHFTLGSTIATARRLTGENTAFPLRFFVRLVVRWDLPLSKGRGYVLRFLPAYE